MSSVINTNIAAIRTHNTYNRNNDYMNQALTRVATGMKVNSAKDGASVYAISEKMRERIRANAQANQNAQNDTALLKTAEGGIGNTIDIIKTLKERAINAANDSNMNLDRNAIQVEVNQLLTQIDENARSVKFNGRTLLNNTAATDDSTKNITAEGVYSASSTDETDETESKNTTDPYLYSEKITLTGNASANTDITDADLNTAITAAYTAANGSAPANNATISLKDAGFFADTNDTAASDSINLKYNGSTSKWYLDDSADAEVYTREDNPDYVAPKNTTDEYLYSDAITETAGSAVTDSGVIAALAAAALTAGSPTDGEEVTLEAAGLFADTNGTAASGKATYNATNDNWTLSSDATATLYTRTKNPDYDDGSGSSGSTLNFYLGGDTGFNVTFSLGNMTTSGLGLNGTVDLSTAANAKESITTIENALQKALNEQTKVGAMESRLGYVSDNLVTMNENLEAADSTMRDSDIAKEMTNYMKYSVLSQAAQYMLAQAGQNAFSVLNLLQQ